MIARRRRTLDPDVGQCPVAMTLVLSLNLATKLAR